MAWAPRKGIAAPVATSAALLIALQWTNHTRLTALSVSLGVLIGIVLPFLGLLCSSQRIEPPLEVKNACVQSFGPALWAKEATWLSRVAKYRRTSIYPSSFVVSDGIDEVLGLVSRDFISSWYDNISQSKGFADSVDSLIRKALSTILKSLEQQDVVETLILRVVPILTQHLEDFSEAERLIRGKKLNKAITESDELDLAIAKRYRNGKLHRAASLASVDTEHQYYEYLRALTSRLMPELLPRSVTDCKSTSTIIQELLSRALFGPIMSSLAEPDTWNRILEVYGKTVLHDRKTVKKLRAALDEHSSPNLLSPKQQMFPSLSPHDDERRFERFIRATRVCNNLSDARRFRSEVASQLSRESMRESQDKTYLKRLETGRRILDQRISTLATKNDRRPGTSLSSSDVGQATSSMAKVRLPELLHDATGLSYFMEYMDRQKLMTLVQFWIVVNGFRDPLEDVPDESSIPDSQGQWTSSDRLDIAQIYETYLIRPELRIPKANQNIVRSFLDAGNEAVPEQYGKARSALLRAQRSVLEEMQEKHYPDFRKSDLFFKLVNSDFPPKKDGAGQPPQEGELPRSASLEASSTEQATTHDLSGDAGIKSPARHPGTSTATSHPKGGSLRRDHLLFENQESLNDDHDSTPLFEDSDVAIPTSSSTGDSNPTSHAQVFEAVEAALNDIVTDEMSSSEVHEKSLEHRQSEQALLKEPSLDDDDFLDGNKSNVTTTGKRDKPNITSLGLVSASSRIGVFMDDDLFGDEEKFLEDEYADPDDLSEAPESNTDIHEAVPGDLGLSEAISALKVDIDRLTSQESMVDALTKKAQLTNNNSELRVLTKSKSSLQREIRRKELQRQQYVVQESDSSLYGRARVDIKSVMVGREGDGQEFAFYMIEVSRNAGEHMPATTWVVARRYSEFHVLHQRLRRAYPVIRHLSFPRRRLVMKMQTDFLQRRRLSLEEYLQSLLRMPAVCTSRALRAFLSQRPITNRDDAGVREERSDLISKIYSSVTDGMDEFLGNLPMLDQLSLASPNIVSAAATQHDGAAFPISSGTGRSIGVTASPEAQAELEAFDDQDVVPLVKPVCDLFLEVFELNKSANWLRGRTLVVLLQQLLGGTIERKIREAFRSLVSEDNVLRYLALAKSSFWPGGNSFQANQSLRTDAEKRRSRAEASIILATLLPEVAGGAVGKANAQAAGRRIFAAMNNSRLNTHLAFRVLDEITAILFPAANTSGQSTS